MKNRNHFEPNGDLRDIFAGLAMQSLMNDKAATPLWVATQAYRYADVMLDVHDEVSDTKEIK